MSSSRDMVQLKLQKKLMEEKLKRTDKKIDRLGEIVGKKTMVQTQYRPLDAATMTMTGYTVNDFRIPMKSHKALPPIKHADDTIKEAMPLMNQNILRIRAEQKLKTTGQEKVHQQMKEKEELRLRREKKERKLPVPKIPKSLLPGRYQRGELPCTIEHGKGGTYLSWACPLENLDYEYYLPLLFDGLQVAEHPVSFISRQGIEDMLFAAKGYPQRVIPVIPLLARPLRNALAKYDTYLLLGVLKALQQLITCNEGVGEALMQYGKQFLGLKFELYFLLWL